MLPNKTDIAEFFLNIRIISHWFTFWSRKSWATTASILLYTTSEQFPDPIIIAQFFKNDNTIRKELPFAWMKHPVVHMDKTSIVVYTEQDMIMILQKKKRERNRHAAIQGWLTNCWTDKSARYLTSGFECVIKSITRAFAPNSVTYLYKKNQNQKKKKHEAR